MQAAITLTNYFDRSKTTVGTALVETVLVDTGAMLLTIPEWVAVGVT